MSLLEWRKKNECLAFVLRCDGVGLSMTVGTVSGGVQEGVDLKPMTGRGRSQYVRHLADDELHCVSDAAGKE